MCMQWLSFASCMYSLIILLLLSKICSIFRFRNARIIYHLNDVLDLQFLLFIYWTCNDRSSVISIVALWAPSRFISIWIHMNITWTYGIRLWQELLQGNAQSISLVTLLLKYQSPTASAIVWKRRCIFYKLKYIFRVNASQWTV